MACDIALSLLYEHYSVVYHMLYFSMLGNINVILKGDEGSKC